MLNPWMPLTAMGLTGVARRIAFMCCSENPKIERVQIDWKSHDGWRMSPGWNFYGGTRSRLKLPALLVEMMNDRRWNLALEGNQSALPQEETWSRDDLLKSPMSSYRGDMLLLTSGLVCGAGTPVMTIREYLEESRFCSHRTRVYNQLWATCRKRQGKPR